MIQRGDCRMPIVGFGSKHMRAEARTPLCPPAIHTPRPAILMMLVLLLGCEGGVSPPSTQRSTTIASLSPAMTDLLVAMGLSERLVAVSNFEPPRPETDALTRVGDYRTVDWEQLGRIRPGVILTQYRADKMPEGFAARCDELSIRVVNRKIDSLRDVYETLGELGDALGAKPQADRARAEWDRRVLAVVERVKDRSRPRVLLIVGDSGLSAVGPGTFLDDVLALAGGENVLKDGRDYVTLDRERLASLDPDVVIQLLPGASPQTLEQADRFWKSLPEMRAVRDGKVLRVTAADALLPGYNVLGTLEALSELLHPRTSQRGAGPGPDTRLGARSGMGFLPVTGAVAVRKADGSRFHTQETQFVRPRRGADCVCRTQTGGA